MSDFDNLYNDTVRGSNESFNSDNSGIIGKKREIIHEFFSNRLTQILLMFLWILFAINVVSAILNIVESFSSEVSSPVFTIITTGLTLWLAFLIPYGFYLLYNGSKNNNPSKYIQGVNVLKKYIKITKVILIVFAVIIGLSLLMIIAQAFIVVLIAGFFIGLIFFIAFYIIGIFMNFLDDLLGGYRLEDIDYPLADKIRTYFIVILVFTLIGYIISYWILTNLSNFAVLLEGSLYEELLVNNYKFGFWDFVPPLLTLGQIGFLIHYTKQYDLFTINANVKNKENLRRSKIEETAELE